MILAVVPAALGDDPSRLYALITWPLLLAMVLRAVLAVAPARRVPVDVLALVAGVSIPPVFV